MKFAHYWQKKCYIKGLLHPLVMQNLCGDSRLTRPVRPGDNDEDWLVDIGYHAIETFSAAMLSWLKKRVVASSLLCLASSAASFINCESTSSVGSSMLVSL